jgi:hypothetical protein
MMRIGSPSRVGIGWPSTSASTPTNPSAVGAMSRSLTMPARRVESDVSDPGSDDASSRRSGPPMAITTPVTGPVRGVPDDGPVPATTTRTSSAP